MRNGALGETWARDSLIRLATLIIEFEWLNEQRGSVAYARALDALLYHARDSVDYKVARALAEGDGEPWMPDFLRNRQIV